MRLAVLSDIHGNRLALDAVLDDLSQRGGADAVIDLGDRVSGPLWPVEVMDRLVASAIPGLRGNHDRAVATDPPSEMIASDRYAWAALTEVRRAALGALPATLEPAPGVLACHGRPGQDDAYLLEEVVEGRLVSSSPAAVAARLGDVRGAKLVLCGHSHRAGLLRSPIGVLVVNPGSVGCPAYDDPDPPAHVAEAGTPHARYALLDLHDENPADPVIAFLAVPYDHEAVARRAEANGRPGWAHALRTGTWPKG